MAALQPARPAAPAARAAYLDGALLGKNEWWRYLAAVTLTLFFTFVVGGLPALGAAALVEFDGNPATAVDRGTGMLLGVDVLLTFPVLMFSFVASLAGILLAVALVHRRSPRTLVAVGRPINWRRLGLGALVWAVLAALTVGVEALLYPGRYQWAFDPLHFVPFALLAAVFVPLQASAEELFFRGYLLQGFGLLNRQPLALSVLSGLLFALPHFYNPEVAADFWASMLFYFAFGAAMALFTLLDNGLELALGVHISNNLFTALLANFKGSALETPSLLTASTFSPWFNLAAGLVGLVVFYLVVVRRRTRVNV
jgi:membrane protease YdiL (CAAX protease family)